MPTIEGLAYSLAIAWYDTSFTQKSTAISKLIGQIGAYSYSIYLLHFFVVFKAANYINQNIMDISNFYIAIGWSIICFILMLPVGYLSFRFIEGPFFKIKKALHS